MSTDNDLTPTAPVGDPDAPDGCRSTAPPRPKVQLRRHTRSNPRTDRTVVAGERGEGAAADDRPDHQPRPGAATWYRSDEDRAKSVYRRANPWYRRLARGIIGLGFLSAAAVGLYFGARAVQDYLERDRLPASGADVPDIRATSFLISSTAPAPSVDGTLTIDA